MAYTHSQARSLILKRYGEIRSWRQVAAVYYPNISFAVLRDFATGKVRRGSKELQRKLGITQAKPKLRVKDGARYGDQPGRLGDRI